MSLWWPRHSAWRILAGVVAPLTNDLALIGVVVRAVITARDGSIQFTAAQNSALADGYGLVTAARIAGAGAVAFAQDAMVRAQFEALLPKKKA